MRRRIAKKILNRMVWYCNRSGLWSQVPLNYGLYHRANVALKQKPYYDKEWWLYIMDNFGHTLRTQSWKTIHRYDKRKLSVQSGGIIYER